MKRNEEKQNESAPFPSKKEETEITSDSVENAHATGDGAVQKSDELLPTEDDNKTTTDTTPY